MCGWLSEIVISNKLHAQGILDTKAVILVGNKIDIVRKRDVPIDGEIHHHETP